MSNTFPFIGKTYLFEYDGFVARDTFISDTELSFEILEGPVKGLTGSVNYHANAISDGVYMITWQEADGATVTHVDDFERGLSYSNFTDAQLNLYRMSGTLTEEK